MNDPKAYTVNEVAQALQVSRNRIYDMVATGELPALRLGKTIRIPAEQLDQWIQKNAVRK